MTENSNRLYFSASWNLAKIFFSAHSKLAFDCSSYCIVCWEWPMEMCPGAFEVIALRLKIPTLPSKCWMLRIYSVSHRASEFPPGTIITLLIDYKAMAPHSSTLAWKIPWMEEPGALQSMGSLRVGHDWAPSLSLFTFMHWRRKWQPTPVFLPGESQGQGSLVGCHLWSRTESDTTEATSQQQHWIIII